MGIVFDQSLNTTDSPSFVDGDFSGTVQTEYITGVNGITTDGSIWMRPTLGHVFIRGANSSNIARFSTTGVLLYADLAPQTGGIYSLGLSGQRWANTYSEDGSFSGNLVSEVGGSYKLYGLGTEGDADTEFIEILQDGSTSRFQTNATGTGSASPLVFRSGTSGGYMLANSSQFQIGAGGVAAMIGTAFNVTFNKSILMGAAGLNIGSTTGNRVGAVNAVDGDFSGNGSFGGTIFSEVGGSAKFYNLGVDGDTDTEYGEIKWDSNFFEISTEITGAGTPRSLRMSAGLTRLDLTSGGNVTVVRNNATYMIFGSANITVYRYFRPNSDLGIQFGDVTRRWAWGSFGGLTTHTQTITAASDTLGTSDHTVLCDCTLNSITINLPAAIDGQQYVIKKVDSSINTVTIDGDSSETIDGALTKTLTTQYECVTIVSDGTNWFIVN